MIDISQAENYFKTIALAAAGNAQKSAAIKAALDGTALIKRRVQSSGEKADGGQFSKYSTIDVPVFFFKGRGRTGGDTAYNKLKKKGNFASYQDFREASGLQTKFKDFTFSGRMMNAIKPVVSESTKTLTVIEINGTNPDSRQKIEWQTAQAGNFLIPSKKELSIITENFVNEYVDVLKKAFE
jgi:hypothetical protein